jgi:tetratricopeptide (TPR) repeat protein
LVERHGRARFREAYRLGSVEAAYGRPLGALVREWNEFLDGVAVSPDEVEVARHRFDRPSVFGQVCAREIARLSREAERAAAAGDTRRAIRALESICRDDPQNPLQEAGLFEMLVRGGRAGRARALGARLTGDRRAGLVVRGQVAERLADLDWLSGRSREAALAYEALAAHAPSDDQRRMRLVKARAAGDSRIGHLLRRFILGEGAAPEPAPLAIETLHEVLAQEPDSPLGRYLLGRQLFNQEDFERAVPEIARAIGIGGMDEPIEAEARRVLAISLYRIGRFDEAREGFERIARDGRRPEGARDEAASWARRCRWAVGVGRGLAARDR